MEQRARLAQSAMEKGLSQMTVFCVMVQNTVSPVVEQEHYKEENKIESRVSLYTKWTDSAFVDAKACKRSCQWQVLCICQRKA